MNGFDKFALLFLVVAMTGVVIGDPGLALWGDLAAFFLMVASGWARHREQKLALRRRRMA